MKSALHLGAALWPMLGACALTGSASWPGSSSGGGTQPVATSQDTATTYDSPTPAATSPATAKAYEMTQPCDPVQEKWAREKGFLKGPCWNPPGTMSWAETVTIVHGRRQVKPDPAKEDKITYWFDMPKENIVGNARDANEGTSWLRGYGQPGQPGASKKIMYSPYFQSGDDDPWRAYPAFPVPDVRGKTVAQALDVVDALDLPAVVYVVPSITCKEPHGIICQVRPAPGDQVGREGELTFVMSSDVTYAGTPREVLRLRDFTNQPTEVARAAIAKVGFTSIEVVETDLPCERGLVCDIEPRVDWMYRRDEKIVLKVRRGKR